MNIPGNKKAAGFTLIEIVVTIVVMSIALAAVVPLLSHAFMRSYELPMQLRAATGLHSAMEDIVALQAADTLASLHVTVGPEGEVWGDGYRVVHNRYVTFVGGQETGNPVDQVLLKITLRNALGEQLTRLFAEAP